MTAREAVRRSGCVQRQPQKEKHPTDGQDCKNRRRKKMMDTTKSTDCPKCSKPTRIVKRVKDRERGNPRRSLHFVLRVRFLREALSAEGYSAQKKPGRLPGFFFAVTANSMESSPQLGALTDLPSHQTSQAQ